MLVLILPSFRTLSLLCRARLLSLLLVGVAVLPGCDSKQRAMAPTQTGRQSSDRSERSSAWLDAVAVELEHLPESSIVNLAPEQIVLDATKSSDGQDVLATLRSPPGTTAPIYNYLEVPAGNARFKQLEVMPGDMVKYYSEVKSEVDEEFGGGGRLTLEQLRALMKLPEDQREEVANNMLLENRSVGDIFTTSAVEFKVAQVIDTNTLLIEGTHYRPVTEPARLEITRFKDTRFRDMRIDLSNYANEGVPRLGWEPSPDAHAVEQIVERLNQWLRQSTVELEEWEPATLRATLPESLRNEPRLQNFLSDEALQRGSFSLPTERLRATQGLAYEGRLLQEALWARDICGWVTRDEYETLPRVEALFDWTVRNLQLDDPGETRPAYRPWQSLVLGHATPRGRAWVFAQFCRQRNVPVVILRPDSDSEAEATWWWCGAVVGEDIYLFDAELGVPIPGPDGRPATLAEVVADSEVLRALDLPDDPYPAEASSLGRLVAEVIAGPFALTRRAALLEQRLMRDNPLVLFVDVDRLAEQLQQRETVQRVVLWDYPFRTLLAQINQGPALRRQAALEFEPFVFRPRLWKARLLHFRGRQGREVDAQRGNLETVIDDHADAGRLYTHNEVRPTDRLIEEQDSPDTERAWTIAKQNASYWLGLLAYDRGQPRVALDPWLEVSQLNPAWAQGARYNQARALEALGNLAEAIERLESSTSEVPRQHRVYAQLLKAKLEQKDVVEE